jgi:uncharacterized membrane protein YraQ (UPF0718 family)
VRRTWIFPAGVLVLYGILYPVTPGKTVLALESCAKVGLSLVVPFAFVVVVMFLLTLLIRPSHVSGLLGQHAGAKAIILSAGAGIVSAGPIYAWYPLLKDLKEQGAADGPIAVFLYNRAVKPFLLPVMIGYFGWRYVLVLTFLMILGSILLGYGMQILARNH